MIKSPFIEDSHPKWNSTHTLTFKRNKLAEMHFTNRKANVDIISKGGWFSGDASIFNHKLRLDHLLTHCEFVAEIPVKNSEKKLNGVLRMKLKLRTPLSKPEMKKIESKIIVIGPYPPIEAVPPKVEVSSTSQKTTPTAPATPSIDKRDILDPHNGNRLGKFTFTREIPPFNHSFLRV